MKMKKINRVFLQNLWLLLFLGGAPLGLAKGGKNLSWGTEMPAMLPPESPLCPCFGFGEVNLDLFAMGAKFEGENEELGYGVRVSAFLSTYFGVSLSYGSFLEEVSLHELALSATLRLPIEKYCVSPYVYGGIEKYWGDKQTWGQHIGLGLDWRVFSCSGVFVEGRYSYSDSLEYGQVALGYRMNF